MFISLTFHRSILAPVFQPSHQIANACGLEKCVCCQGGMDPRRVKEVRLLRRVGFADYLHIFNDSSPRRVRALPQLGFFDTVNYSSHLITAALCLTPPACSSVGSTSPLRGSVVARVCGECKVLPCVRQKQQQM